MKRLAAAAALLALFATACSGTSPSTQDTADGTTVATAAPSGETECSTPRSAQVGPTSKTITVDGTPRSYQINIPPNYDGTEPTPVVMTFHGRGSNSNQQLLVTGFSDISNKNDFILVAPDAIGGQWDLPDGSTNAVTDTNFVTQLLVDLRRDLCTDVSRTYASGFSLGSVFTLLLACAQEQTFAAFGGAGASFYRSECDNSPPAPIIYFHGTKDLVVPFKGGLVQGSPANDPTSVVSPAATNMADWATHNKCQSGPSKKNIGDTTRLVWSDCANSADVDFYRTKGGGHTWPGSSELVAAFLENSLGKTTQAVNASELMWEFFSQYRLAP
jgi:polyhydroxybutyrate depolymerase